VAFVAREAARKVGLDLAGARVAVQGFGNVGSHAAEAFAELGCRVVAVSDALGGVRNPAGLDVDELLRRARAGVTGHDGMDAEHIDNDELLATECEILVPAAVGGVLHEGNADRVRARMVVEGANVPLTPGADRVLAERGTIVVPDILANAGGVIVSYLEWVQNLQNVRWERALVDEELSRRLVAAHDQVWERAGSEGCSLRQAAHRLALSRVAEAERLRGSA
jgi:glutamate dehydrogenase (NAD(P)+)